MLYILAVIIGFFIGCGFTLFVKSKPQKSKYLRRAILDHQFSVTDRHNQTSTLDVQFEVGELEKTGNKSKIEIISITPNQSEYCTDGYKKKVSDLINHTWIDSTKLQWIEDDISEKRNQKIDQLLS